MSIILEILSDDEKLTRLSKLMFNAVDEDKSGQIDRNELRSALLKLDGEESDNDLISKIDQVLDILDSDGSGVVEFYEFKELVRQLLEAFNN